MPRLALTGTAALDVVLHSFVQCNHTVLGYRFAMRMSTKLDFGFAPPAQPAFRVSLGRERILVAWISRFPRPAPAATATVTTHLHSPPLSIRSFRFAHLVANGFVFRLCPLLLIQCFGVCLLTLFCKLQRSVLRGRCHGWTDRLLCSRVEASR